MQLLHCWVNTLKYLITSSATAWPMADFQHAGSPEERKEAYSIVVIAVTGGWVLCIDVASSHLNPLRHCVFAEQ